MAHFLAAQDITLWAARFSALAPSLNPVRTAAPDAQLSTPVEKVAKRRAQHAQDSAAHCSALQLLDAVGDDIADAVLAAHSVLTGERPLGRRLACLPQRLHQAALRTAMRASSTGDAGATFTVDVADAHMCGAIAQLCSEGQMEVHKLHVRMSTAVQDHAMSSLEHIRVDTAQGLMQAAAARSALHHLRFDGREGRLAPTVLKHMLQCDAAMGNLRSLSIAHCQLAPYERQVMLRHCLQRAQHSLTSLTLHACSSPRSGDSEQWIRTLAVATELQHLDLSGSQPFNSSIFAALGQLTALRTLNCSAVTGSGRGFYTRCAGLLPPLLLTLCRLSQLTALQLSHNSLEGHFGGFAQALRNMAQLANLALCACGLNANAVAHIASGMACRAHLHSLDLSHNPECGDKGHEVLARNVLQHATALTRLDMRSTGLRAWHSGAIQALLPYMTSLRSIGWLSPPADVLGAADQQLCVSLAQLLYLQMQVTERSRGMANEQGAASVHAAAGDWRAAGMQHQKPGDFAPMSHIVQWELEANPVALALGAARPPEASFYASTLSYAVTCSLFPEAGCASEAYWRQLGTAVQLTELRFACGAAAAQSLASHLTKLVQLQVLSFAHCEMDSACSDVMRAAAHIPQLTQLDLSHCGLADPELAACAEQLLHMTALRKLALMHNDYTAAALVGLAQALAPCRQLQQLLAGSAQHCKLTKEQVALLGDALFACHELVEVELPHAVCTCAELQALLPGVVVYMSIAP